MSERITQGIAKVGRKSLDAWNEYGWPVISTAFVLRPLHFAVTRLVSGIQQGDRVLEVGSGYPWYEMYAGKVGQEGLFVALDYNPRIQKRSQTIGRFIDTNLRKKEKATVAHIVADVGATMPFDDNTFDKVIVNQGPRNFEEFHRVLKPGGRLLMSYGDPLTLPISTEVNHLLIARKKLFENIKRFPGAPNTLLPALAFLHYKGFLPGWAGYYQASILGMNWYISADKPKEIKGNL